MTAAGIGAAALGLACRAVRRRRVLAGHGDERLITVRSGNRLAYRYTKAVVSTTARMPCRPVAVCLSGSLATMEHWAWVTDQLTTRRAPIDILNYDRAGYGRSQYLSRHSAPTETALGDLADLIKDVCDDRGIILVGHAQGAATALRAADDMMDRVIGVVLVEPALKRGDGPPSQPPGSPPCLPCCSGPAHGLGRPDVTA
ncbi:alpha/beta hydrolase [Streptomyces sp. NPDC006475]|uniref:alpha/beta hydrolase n=1 Tax=Streptomyces sp. NPDC006475 TaxID=3155719 RepID=UPI0033B4451D